MLFGAFLIFRLYQWVTRGAYGINNGQSFVYLAVMYGLALVIYVGFRLLRRAQSINNMVYVEILEE